MENIKKFTDNLIEKIKQYSKITLYVHVTPDCDAIGSAWAFLNFVKLNFKNKQIRIAGLSKLNTTYLPSFFQLNYDEVDEQFVKDSIGVVFDLSSYDRIYDKQLFKHEISFRFDHHLFINQICTYELVDDKASSTCELVAMFIEQTGLKINSTIANSLYFGLLTDTIRFLTSNTNVNTYKVMAWLEKSQFLDKKMVHDQLYLRSFNDVKLDKKLYKCIKFKNNYALLIANKAQTKKLGSSNIKNRLFLMAGLKDIFIYGIIYYDSTTNIYKGSLRSREYNVNAIAKKFNGGGHKFASGFKLDCKKDLKQLEIEIQRAINLKQNYE